MVIHFLCAITRCGLIGVLTRCSTVCLLLTLGVTGPWGGHGLVHLQLLSGPRFRQKFHIIIPANASSVCCTSRLDLGVPESRWRTDDANDAQPCSAGLQSRAERGSLSSSDSQA